MKSTAKQEQLHPQNVCGSLPRGVHNSVICLAFVILVETRVRFIAVYSVIYDHVSCIVRLVNAVIFCKSVNFKFAGKM